MVLRCTFGFPLSPPFLGSSHIASSLRRSLLCTFFVPAPPSTILPHFFGCRVYCVYILTNAAALSPLRSSVFADTRLSYFLRPPFSSPAPLFQFSFSQVANRNVSVPRSTLFFKRSFFPFCELLFFRSKTFSWIRLTVPFFHAAKVIHFPLLKDWPSALANFGVY